MKTEKIGVWLKLDRYRHPSGVYASRYPQLGLTGYGRSAEDSEKELDSLFRKFISVYTATGQLEARFKQVGLKYHRQIVQEETIGGWEAIASEQAKVLVPQA